MRNIKFTTKLSLTDSFAIIGQSFQLIVSGSCPGRWAASLLFVFDWLSTMETIYGIINSSLGVTFFFESDSQFLIFLFVESQFRPFYEKTLARSYRFYEIKVA